MPTPKPIVACICGMSYTTPQFRALAPHLMEFVDTELADSLRECECGEELYLDHVSCVAMRSGSCGGYLARRANVARKRLRWAHENYLEMVEGGRTAQQMLYRKKLDRAEAFATGWKRRLAREILHG